MSINGGFNSYKSYYTRFRQAINGAVFFWNTTTMSNLLTNGITKKADFEKPNHITDKEDSDGKSVSAQMEVVKMRENPLNKDAPMLSLLEWNDEMNQYNIGDKVRFLSENSRDLVKIMGCNTLDGNIKYIVKFPNKY
eukprot:15364578-Ditylum_brightwellii.AAC.1